MVATGKSKNTASNYFTGVNIVSKHCGFELFDISDVAELERLYQLYGPQGVHAQVGASNSGNVQSGLKQWLEYQRQIQLGESLSIDPVEGRKQWDAFLSRWPVSKLRELTLEQYYGTEGDDSFYSWMRDHTKNLGDFKEGPLSAGVRPKKGDTEVASGADTQVDGQYIWYSIHGNSALEAFESIRSEFLAAVEAVQGGELSLITRLKSARGSRVWKVAFLYQQRSQPLVLPFYTQKRLRQILGPGSKGTVLLMQQQLMSRRGEREVLAFAAELERAAAGMAAVKQEKESTMVKTSAALNQILFGPPGTGKTYNTINQALAILAPELLAQNSGDDADSRERLKAEFDRFVTAERVRFVTFHQSFSYEDFVEGLRADSDADSGQVKYTVESGVFKRLCDDARTRPATDLGVRANPAIWKISIDGTGSSPSKSYCLANGEARIGWGETGDMRGDYEQSSYYQRLGDGTKGTLGYFAEQMAVGDILLCIHSATQVGSVGVVTSDYRYEEQVPSGVISSYQHVRSVRWLYRNINLSILPLNDDRQFTLKTVYAMERFTWADLLSYLQQQDVQPAEPVTVGEVASEPYVLIIDEINRGNVSRIFGELITLIEPSKRDGAAEALSLKLPYSKKPFSVPKNVYLIGTMNTADRSLAGLDIALRRRFVFREMPPRPELLDDLQVEGVNIGQLLRVMNQRIEVLLDRDHCLGHAYFIPLRAEGTLERLEVIFRNQILPLLQEYFFEDWQRIQWVLNDHRKATSDQFVQQRGGSVEALFGQEVGQGLERSTWSLNDEAFERQEAYLGIVDHQMQGMDAVVKQEASHGEIVVRELASGSVEVLLSGVRQEPSKPVLRELANQLGVGTLNSSGNLLNTRSLGRQLINQLRNGHE
jgi:5-methylcytosine-specific restriction protein B